jgi:hypothetical protein
MRDDVARNIRQSWSRRQTAKQHHQQSQKKVNNPVKCQQPPEKPEVADPTFFGELDGKGWLLMAHG